MKIYIIKNSVNSKVYIGQTKHKLSYRLKKHFYSAIKQLKKNKFHTAIRLLGIGNFYIEEIESLDNISDLNKREIYWIESYDSIENGYNDQYGGIGGKFTNEVKEKLKNKSTGSLNSFYGKKHSQQTKSIMKVKRVGRKPSQKLCDKDLIGIKEMWINGCLYSDICNKFGISMGRISQISKTNGWIKLKSE